MKKILLSIAMIGFVGALAAGGTGAFFSDTVKSSGNTFTAGTVDIGATFSASTPITLSDMKPGYTAYSNFVVTNTGTNPVNVFKKVDNITTDGVSVNEPECIAQSGSWDGTSCIGGTEAKDLENQTIYDLSVVLKDTGGTVRWNQTLYSTTTPTLLSAVVSAQDMLLGMLPVGWSMEVTESYHMLETADNKYQSDKMTFDITVTGEQLKGTLVLEDKDTTANDWRVKSETAPKVTVSYAAKDATINISAIAGKTIVAGTHSLITYPEAYSTPSRAGWPGFGVVLATVTTDGSGNITGFTPVTTDPGTFRNMKVWLVPNTLLTAGTATFSGWNAGQILFDTALADYIKS